MMQLIGRYAARQEVYSIDEPFLGLNGEPEDLVFRGRRGAGTPWPCTPACPGH